MRARTLWPAIAFATGVILVLLGYALGLAAGASIVEEIDQEHIESDARLRLECVRMGVAAERGYRAFAEHMWGHAGPTGGMSPISQALAR